jgi:uncharacterized membrane protein
MGQPTVNERGETFTFRLDPALKTAFMQTAAAEDKPAGELLRQLLRDYVVRTRRQEFTRQAQRQSLEAAAHAAVPSSDEAAVQRELDADLDQFDDQWK